MVPITSAKRRVFFKVVARNKGVLEIRVLDASQKCATFSACAFDFKSESSLIIQQYLSWLELASCQVEIMNNEILPHQIFFAMRR